MSKLVLTRIGIMLKGIGVGVSKLYDICENRNNRFIEDYDSRLTSSGGKRHRGVLMKS